ncbi:hypothetical protein GW932_03545 [archaeon]|nr:hypothetical protein [archaeon]
MNPKIEFRYSDVYDRNYRESKFIQKYLKEKNQTYPDKKEILEYIKKVEKLWNKKSEEILKLISKVSGLKWKEKRIICYVIGVGRPFSDPLTIRTYGKDTKRFINTLTHELIHNIFIQNTELYKNWNKYLKIQYPNEARITQSHILLSAIHWIILEKEGKNAIKKEIEKYNKNEDYKKAWEIIKKETPKKIINKFKKIIN